MSARTGSEDVPGDPGGEPLAHTVEPAAVPRQMQRSVQQSGAGEATGTAAGKATATDSATAADAAAAEADAAAVENLLRCWVRENGVPRPEDDVLRLPLDATGVVLRVPVRHWSATDWHRFGPPRLDLEGLQPAVAPQDPLDAVTLAAVLGREAAPGGGAAVSQGAALVGRVADSVQRTACFLARRRAAPEAPTGTSPFLDAEQSLVLGHPLHPTPKSIQGLSEAESHAYAPELRAAFPLHWMAVDASVFARDSAWTERGRTVPAEVLAVRLAGNALVARLPAGTVPLPLHPWQARELLHRSGVSGLLDAGLLHDLGPAGEPWHPTSSVRTVMRTGGPAMLKLSLALPITNSRRENLRKELLRGVEVHRLLRAGLGAEWQAAHPGFDIVRDPAWLGVNGADGEPVHGLDTVVRHNPFGPTDDVVCVAGLTSPRPCPGTSQGPLRSRLTEVVERLAARTGRPVAAVATEWFLRYLDVVVRPVLWLDAQAGIALEAHQQNTLVLLDADGWPAGGRYRDNQGYYFRASRRDALEQRLPGIGIASDSFVADEVTDERFAYYLGINNIFGLVGAFGAQHLADEQLLLAAVRRFLRSQAHTSGGVPVSPLPALLLDSPTLRCKANLLTRLHGMDELVGPVETQSVYVTVANPLAR